MFLTGLISVLSAANVAPQVPPADATLQCELHIWPAERLKGQAFSLGQIKGRASGDQIEGTMQDLLSPESQLAALHDVNIAKELMLPIDTRIVEHSEPLDNKTIGAIKTRRVDSRSKCYSELIIVQHLLTEDIVWGDHFGSTFLFRNFEDKTEVRDSLKGNGGSKLKVLTQTQSARPVDASEIVRAAVRANFLEYAKKARAQMPATSVQRR